MIPSTDINIIKYAHHSSFVAADLLEGNMTIFIKNLSAHMGICSMNILFNCDKVKRKECLSNTVI